MITQRGEIFYTKTTETTAHAHSLCHFIHEL